MMKQRQDRRHRSSMRITMCLALLAVSLAGAVVHAQAAVDVATLGPQVGARVPAFTASDQTGRVHTLQSLLGPKGAMLVFSRSADW